MTLFEFLEQYLQRLEGPLAIQVWGRFVQLSKDMVASSKEFRPPTYYTLRYARKSWSEDPAAHSAQVLYSACRQDLADAGRRGQAHTEGAAGSYHRNSISEFALIGAVQETFTKLVELCLLANKSSDPGSWVRRAVVPGINGTGRDSPLLRGMCLLHLP